MVRPSPISATVPYDEDGVHHGFLRVPYSRNDSAWGSLMIPICVVRNGDGPTALLTGANHGDEYEGPIALQHLAQSIDMSNVKGRVMIVPALNYPAFRAGTRTSPIDKGNMNRIFPGRPDGSITEKIADYIQRVIVAMSDIVVDIHAGGKSLDFVPFAMAHVLPDKDQQAKCVAAMRAFNAPYSATFVEIDNVGMLDTAVEEQGKVFVSTELGGGGTATARSIAIARKGIRNVLVHSGIVDGEPVIEPSIDIDVPDDDCFVVSEHDGLIEFAVDLGSSVQKTDLVARVWPIDRTGQAPVDYHARRGGILVGRHFPGLVKAGDCMAVVGVIRE
ncbi:MAG: N(2)-acetyl-L-2,4-diaminobutanoate deacetylase DoeB [Hyphomicrobiaceae bacterium]